MTDTRVSVRRASRAGGICAEGFFRERTPPPPGLFSPAPAPNGDTSLNVIPSLTNVVSRVLVPLPVLHAPEAFAERVKGKRGSECMTKIAARGFFTLHFNLAATTTW